MATDQERIEKARRYQAIKKAGLDDVLADAEQELVARWLCSRTPADDLKLAQERDGLAALRRRLDVAIGDAEKIKIDEAAATRRAASSRKKG